MLKSPTTEAMKNSIIAITYKRNAPEEPPVHSQTLSPQKEGFSPSKTTYPFSPEKINDSSPTRKNKRAQTMYAGFFAEGMTKFQIPVDGKLVGHKPCARDGHSALIYKNKMIVFGGDRHKMAFNDVYIFNLDQASNIVKEMM
jgi:hypothetical protein